MRSDAPGWIQGLKLRFECLARHIFRPGVAKGGEIDSVLNRIPVEVFLVESPATLLGVITSDVVPAELVLSAAESRGFAGKLISASRWTEGPGVGS